MCLLQRVTGTIVASRAVVSITLRVFTDISIANVLLIVLHYLSIEHDASDFDFFALSSNDLAFV